MSNALTIAAVTAILKNLLENSSIQQAAATGMGDVTITTLPPDRVAVGSEERPQLNLYLYRLTPNTSWRPTTQPTLSAPQQEQALALNLHYLLSAYSERDFQAEVLLGTALDCLQKSTSLSGAQISTLLASMSTTRSGNATLKALVQAARTLPLKEIRVAPEFLSLEDLSKLWSSLQAHARPSVTYQVAVTLSTARDEQLPATHARKK
jgi:Pvc16 N-terminal domain